jgi:hypothetical protein
MNESPDRNTPPASTGPIVAEITSPTVMSAAPGPASSTLCMA